MALDDKNKPESKSSPASQAHGQQSVGADPKDSPRTDKGPQFSLGQRFGIGVNVAVTVIAAAALLILANWIATVKSTHRDWSSLGRYSLSQRTRRIVEEVKAPITLTVLYNSDDPRKQRDEASGVEYKGRLMDLLGDVRAVGGEVKVNDVVSADQREELAARLEEDLANRAADDRKLIDEFVKSKDRWTAELGEELRRLTALAGAEDTWAGRFIQTRAGCEVIRRSIELVNETAKDLAKSETGRLTAYDKKVETLTKALTELAENLTNVQGSFRQMSELAKKAAGDDGGVAANSARLAKEIEQAFGTLSVKLDAAAKGKPAASQPSGSAGETIVKAVDQLRDLLIKQSRLLEQFGKDQPAIYTYGGWVLVLQDQPIELPDVFQLPAQELAQLANAVNHADTPEALAEIVAPLKKAVGRESDFVTQLYTAVTRMLTQLKQVDPASQKLLADSDANKILDKMAGQVGRMQDRLKSFKPLATRGLADKFKQDNLVLVEVGPSAPQLLTFDEVWPQTVSSDPGRNEKTPLRRTFNGDAAIGSALLAASRGKLAEVVFVTCVGEPPPATNPYQPPPPAQEGPLPMSMLTVLRDRLDKANLKVSEWNLARSLTPPPPAYPSEAVATSRPDGKDAPLPRVYVVLPPAPKPAENPEEPTPPEARAPKFGPAQRDALAAAIRDGGRAIFLTGYHVGGMRNPYTGEAGLAYFPPAYEWSSYLETEWGLKVLPEMQIMQGLPTPQDGVWKIARNLLFHRLINQFDPHHPVGKPLANQRVLLLFPAPIEKVAGVKGVRHDSILEIPSSDRAFWATAAPWDEVRSQIQNQGLLQLGPDDKKPPFNVMVEASRADAKGGQSKVIVFSAGLSFLDFYLRDNVVRMSDEEGDHNDPPPDMDSEIVLNSVYYLAGLPDLIATGAVAVPPINVPKSQMTKVYVGVVGGLPLAVLLAGGVVILARRRKR